MAYSSRIWASLFITAMVGSGMTSAGGKVPLAEWKLHDSLGHHWTGELLHYTLDLKPPIEPKQPLAVVDASGTPIAVQVLEKKTNAQGKVIQVRLALITDLKPFEQIRFRLLAAEPPARKTDLEVQETKGRWLLGNSKIGVAIPTAEGGSKEGKPFAEIAAPILAIRQGSTPWVGKGWLSGTAKVYAWKTEILAQGPVLAWARITYDFGKGKTYRVDIRVPAGQPVVLVREERNLPEVTAYETDPAKGDVFHLALASGLKPTHAFSKRGLGSSGYFVEAGPKFQGTYLTPAQMHWIPSCCNIVGAWREENESAPFIGLFPRFLSKWDRPHQTFVPLVWDAQDGLTARFFLNHGSREWGLLAGTKKDMIVPQDQGGELIGGYYGALLLKNQWGETPLDKVKDWVLDWGADRFQTERKYKVTDRGRGSMPYFAEQFLNGGQQWHDTYIHVHQTWTGEGDAWDRYQEMLKTAPADQRLSLRAGAAFVMYKQTDPDYWPEGNWIGPSNPNMIYMGNSAMVLGAVALRDHPAAKAWAARGTKAVQQNLIRSTSADGAWIECPGYDGAGISPILQAALELRRAGLGDLFADGRLLKVAMYHANMVTPPDPRTGDKVRHLPEYGDSWDLRRQDHDGGRNGPRPTFWKKMVPIYKDTHPREVGQILWALGEKTGPVPIVPIEGKSQQVAGFGAIFRHAFNTPNESYLAIHQDSFGFGHYHFDLGALTFFGKGAPLCTDWPSMYTPQINEAWMHNCVSVNRINRFAYRGRPHASLLTPRADYTRSRVYYDNAHPPKGDPKEDDVGALPTKCWQRQVVFIKGSNPESTAYLVVRDSVNDDQPTEWNLWTLSDKLRLQKKQAHVRGLYGVDLTIGFFVGPDEVPSTEMFGFGDPPPGTPKGGNAKWTEPAAGVKEVEVPRQFLYQQNVVRLATPKGGEYGAVIFPLGPKDKEPQIVSGPQGTVTVFSAEGEDTIFVYPTDRSVKVGDIVFEGRAGVVCRRGGKVEFHLLEGKTLRAKE